MELSDLQEVKVANPRGQDFQVKWSSKKEEFTFSDKMFTTLQLEYNSVSEFVHPDYPVIGICAGDSGTLMKKVKGHQKGKKMKAAALSATLVGMNFVSGKIEIESLGEMDGKHYYRLVQNNEAEPKVAPENQVSMDINAKSGDNDEQINDVESKDDKF